MPHVPDLGPDQQPPLPFVQMRQQPLELHGQLVTNFTRNTHA
ncbi:hypothetical protein ACFYPT_35465 [Streptomyces sp. NPDC005529]